MAFAPIALFVYNRPDHTRRTLEALSRNELADQSHLFIFADGPKQNVSEDQLDRIRQTRAVIREKQWCGKVDIIEADKNKGLAQSIIDGVTKIVNEFGKIIVLEDDLLTGKYFLQYMNDGLEKYKDERKIWHITGWRDPVVSDYDNYAFLYPVMDCWGWATWSDRWQFYKKDCDYYISNFTKKMIWQFNLDGCCSDMWQQILNNKSGIMNTWAIFWYAAIFLKQGLCLAPCRSLVRNIGFDSSGIHCENNPYRQLYDSIDYKITDFPSVIEISKEDYCLVKNYEHSISFVPFLQRVKSKLKRMLSPMYHRMKSVGNIGYVFMLHRVAEKETNNLIANEAMKVSPMFLDRFISDLKKDFDIIAIQDIEKYVQRKRRRKFIVFTMDDGYKDNLTNALPVFKKHNVPFTIFVSGSFPERDAVMWWYELEDLILHNDKISLSNGKFYSCITKEAKEETFHAIRSDILKLDQKNLVSDLNKLFADYDIDWLSKCEQLCLSWDDLQQLADDPLVTLAAHTRHHYSLRALESEQDVYNEINEGLLLFNDKIGIAQHFFAYPYGTNDEADIREWNIVSQMPFSMAFMGEGGAVKKHDIKKRKYEIPRIFLTEEIELEKIK